MDSSGLVSVVMGIKHGYGSGGLPGCYACTTGGSSVLVVVVSK